MNPELEREIRLSRLVDWQYFLEFWNDRSNDDNAIEDFIHERIKMLSDDNPV